MAEAGPSDNYGKAEIKANSYSSRMIRQQCERMKKVIVGSGGNPSVLNFTVEDFKHVANPTGYVDQIKELNQQVKERKASIRRKDEEIAKSNRETEKACQEIKRKGEKMRKKYLQSKATAEKLEKDCNDIQERREMLLAEQVVYKPLFDKLGVDVAKMTCPEGKPINRSGEEGTCNGWDCPMNSTIQSKNGQQCEDKVLE